jgi:signal transduction histidine kinase
MLSRLQPDAFDAEDVRILEQFANNVAVALDNAQLYSQVYQTSMEEERARLARDLHDSVTQILFSANLLAEVLPRQMRSDPVEAESNLNEMRRLIHAAMAETRVLLFELRPAAVEGVPLGELLALLTESVTSRSDVKFQLSLDNVPSLPPEVQTAFYRITQEALNNVVKHSQASLVRVILQERPDDSSQSPARPRTIKLSVVDNGVGLDRSKSRRGTFGLQNMRERAAAIGAELSIVGERNAGTRVVLTWYDKPGDKAFTKPMNGSSNAKNAEESRGERRENK